MHPFVDAAVTALLGGLAVYFIRAAPFVESPFKTWACYLIAAGPASVALGQLGVLHQVRAVAGG